MDLFMYNKIVQWKADCFWQNYRCGQGILYFEEEKKWQR